MAKYIIAQGIRIAKEFTPETFGRLTTIGPRFMIPTGVKRKHAPRQVCQCDCGNVGVYWLSNLRKGDTNSCGCLHAEKTSLASSTHRMSKTPTYSSWSKMKSRCYREKDIQYPNYGERGIRVCDRWLEPETGFLNFLVDMGERPSKNHSIDRIDTNGNYCPENCRWATPMEQGSNKRNNHLVEIDGKIDTITNWCRHFNIQPSTVKRRIKRGWTAASAVSTPSGPTGPKKHKTPIKRNVKVAA